MTPETWQRLKTIFQAAIELEADAQASFLDDACAGDAELRSRVEKLIASHNGAGLFLQSPAVVDVGAVTATETEQQTGKRIGPYEIIRELGHGGMGTVYLAVRADDQYRKQVAIKLVNRGMDTELVLRRFMMERQILANLEHPNIARLLEGGSTPDGLPYFVMEYIEGSPINEYCDAHRFSTAARLELFREVCAALHYAHQNLVVHRDIKPSNILVTAGGVPKLLDFGIAKLLSPGWDAGSGELTASMVRLMTPEYASPEQLRGLSITTATDVYSLGVVFYELLCGHHPYHLISRRPEEVVQIILQEEPLRPSVAIVRTEPAKSTEVTPESISQAREETAEKLRRRLSGDLDNIVLKALRKEPQRRYASVQEFSEDIRRHLEGLPVAATPDTFNYRAAKFIRRHKAAVFATAAVVITLIAATTITAWQARVARRERDKAERRFNQVRKLAHSVLFDYHDGIEELPGSTPVREKMVKDALEYLDNLSAEGAGDPTLQRELATAYEKVGDVQGNPYGANLGNQDGALASYRKALALREALYTANRSDVETKTELGIGYKRVADILWAKGENDEALSTYRKAFTTFEELSHADPTNALYVRYLDSALIGVAHVQTQISDFHGALDSYRKCLANEEALHAAHPDDPGNVRMVAIANLKVGDALMDVHDFATALSHYEKSVEGFASLAAAVQNKTSAARELGLGYARIANAQSTVQNYDKAVEFAAKAIEQQKQVAIADPDNVQSRFDIAATYQNLGDSYLKMKKLDQAALAVGEAIRIFREALTRNPNYLQAQANFGVAYQTYAEILLAKGDANGAVENFRKALDLLERDTVRDSQMDALAKVYNSMGDAEKLLAHQASGGSRQLELLKDACELYQKSSDLWRELGQQGKLSGEGEAIRGEVLKSLEQCGAALSKP